METIRFDLLKELADHLMKPQEELAHDVFNFNHYNSTIGHNKCKTLGCAWGEAPLLWSSTFKWVGDMVLLKEDSSHLVCSDSMRFLRITEEQFLHLFVPFSQSTTHYGGKRLGRFATKEEVAENIYTFIEVMENGKINL